MPVYQIRSLSDFKTTLKQKQYVMVNFTATWCAPCKVIKPIFKSLSDSEEFEKVLFLMIDVDEHNDISSFCDVVSMPTFHLYKDGNRIWNAIGAGNPEKLKNILLTLDN